MGVIREVVQDGFGGSGIPEAWILVVIIVRIITVVIITGHTIMVHLIPTVRTMAISVVGIMGDLMGVVTVAGLGVGIIDGSGSSGGQSSSRVASMKIRGVDFVMYPVSDLARAAGFYREVLGLAQGVYSEEFKWAEFDCGNVTLALKGGEDFSKRVVGGRVALAVDDIQAAHEAMKRHGVRILSGPTDYSGCWGMEIADPDGNVIILHQRADGSFGN